VRVNFGLPLAREGCLRGSHNKDILSDSPHSGTLHEVVGGENLSSKFWVNRNESRGESQKKARERGGEGYS